MALGSLRHITTILVCICTAAGAAGAADRGDGRVRHTVDTVIKPLMEEHGIPGMAVGIVTPEGHAVFEYGVASRKTGKPVAPETLFEIGSVSKTFTATLAAYAEVKGHLSLSDSATRHLPALQGSSLDRVSLLNLATHTPGGMPLQFPDEVTNDDQMMAYFKAWKPTYAPGTYRTYANPSVGLLGLAAAKAMGEDFVTLMQDTLYPALGLKSTYLAVPEAETGKYAQGYTKKDQPIRMTPGVLDSEAYGVRTTAGDLVRFIEANIGRLDLDADVQKAIAETHTGHYKLGAMTQDLIWEQYEYPVELKDLLTGNSPQVSYKPNAVSTIDPPMPPRKDVWINKTGSTNGFGAYIAFVPQKELGIVLLANKNYPMDARVTAAYRILTELSGPLGPE